MRPGGGAVVEEGAAAAAAVEEEEGAALRGLKSRMVRSEEPVRIWGVVRSEEGMAGRMEGWMPYVLAGAGGKAHAVDRAWDGLVSRAGLGTCR
jgi:hypothetical protein